MQEVSQKLKKIAAMAECHDIALAPHCPLGPIALAACLTVDFTSYNAVIQEQSVGIHYNVGRELMDYVKDRKRFAIINGDMFPSDKPGIGVDIDEKLVQEEDSRKICWHNPVWRHADGSIAEW